MTRKSAIDRQREGAITLEVGGDDDNSQIREFLSTPNALYTITDQAVYKVQLADDIDPKRTNPHAPNLSQKIIPAGYSDEIVARILLTTKYIFDKKNAQVEPHLGEFFEAVIDLTKDVLELQRMILDLKNEIAEKEDFIQSKAQKPNGFSLPSITDLKTKVYNILVKADKTKDNILLLYKIQFLPDEENKPKLFKYREALQNLPNMDDETLTGWDETKKFLDLIRNARNCSEHSKPKQQVLLNDFIMQPDGSIMPPLIEIDHKETPIRTLPLVEFLDFLEEMLLNYSELTSVFIKKVLLLSGEPNPFNMWIVEFPEEERHHPHVRFYKSINMGGVERILG